MSDSTLPLLPDLEEPAVPAWPGDFREVGEFRLFVRHAAPTSDVVEPALFVHGLGGASTNWTDVMYLLRGHVDGQAPDLPGFGCSPPPPGGDYRLDTHVRAVVRLAEAAGARVHLFGNSLGGAVATRVAAERPDLVRTLTLVSPALPSLRPRVSSLHLPLFLAPGVGARLFQRSTRQSPERRAQMVLALCYGDPRRVHPERKHEAVEEVRRRAELEHAGDAFLASLRGLAAEYLDRGPRALWRQAAHVSAPTLLVYGAKDRLVDARLAARAATVFRASRVVVLPDSGHVAQLEHPEVVARAFLNLSDESAPLVPELPRSG